MLRVLGDLGAGRFEPDGRGRVDGDVAGVPAHGVAISEFGFPLPRGLAPATLPRSLQEALAGATLGVALLADHRSLGFAVGAAGRDRLTHDADSALRATSGQQRRKEQPVDVTQRPARHPIKLIEQV